jgi:hypothetical protein
MKVCLAVVAAAVVLLVCGSSPITAGTLPDISGIWYANGSHVARCSISQSGTSVTLRNQEGRSASGSLSGNTLDTDWGAFGGGHITGTISSDLRRIKWSNGSVWLRESPNETSTHFSSAVASATTKPTPEPTPTPERLRIQSYVVSNYKAIPIHVSKVWLGNASASQGRRYEQCVWFRNVSTKVATSVEFSFVVERHSGTVEADFGGTDRGTFTPPVNIDDHCWHGHLWSDRVVRLMSREVVTVKRVTFADETSWEHGMPFLRGYEDNGTPLPEPTEQHPPTPKPTPEPTPGP